MNDESGRMTKSYLMNGQWPLWPLWPPVAPGGWPCGLEQHLRACGTAHRGKPGFPRCALLLYKHSRMGPLQTPQNGVFVKEQRPRW